MVTITVINLIMSCDNTAIRPYKLEAIVHIPYKGRYYLALQWQKLRDVKSPTQSFDHSMRFYSPLLTPINVDLIQFPKSYEVKKQTGKKQFCPFLRQKWFSKSHKMHRKDLSYENVLAKRKKTENRVEKMSPVMIGLKSGMRDSYM